MDREQLIEALNEFLRQQIGAIPNTRPGKYVLVGDVVDFALERLTARDAEWIAAIEKTRKVREAFSKYPTEGGHSRSYTAFNAALDAVKRAMKI